MDRARRRWPRLSRLQVITLCYFTMALVDLAGELVWVRSGFYTFIGPRDLAPTIRSFPE